MDVQIEITNTYCKVLTPLDTATLAALRDECSFRTVGAEYKALAFRRRGAKWDGTKRLFNIQTRRFPIGLQGRVTRLLQSRGYTVNFKHSRRIADNQYDQQYTIQNYDNRDYQTRAVSASIVNGNGIVKAATGSGKTTIAARTICAFGKRTVFIVHTRDLLYQTIESFQRMFPLERIGQIGDGKFEFDNITVATMQSLAIIGGIEIETNSYDEDNDNLKESKESYERKEIKAKFEEFRQTVGCVMFDEVQLVGSQTAYSVRFLFDCANHAFGYSASPWRDDGSDMMIEAAFGDRICDITASELIDLGYLVQPIITIKQVQDHIHSGTKYAEIYKSAIVDNPMRNIQVANDALEQYRMGRNTLVLIQQIAHGNTLEAMLREMGAPAVFISGKSRMKDRRQTIQDMRDGKAPIVIASTIADVGLDVPRLQSIVEAGAGKSSVTALQRLGRVMRPFAGKDKCYFITYQDTAPYLRDQAARKVEIWSTEPRFIIERK